MRLRLGYAGAIVLTMMLGLAVRAFADRLLDPVASHAGDALWAAMVYYGYRLLLAHRHLVRSIGWSALTAAAIECSQLYQAEWINAVRATTLGALVLGHGFLAVDLVRYAAGIAIAAGADWLVTGRRHERQPTIR